ncbi:protein mono-ADP-ribosyltransferase PARP11-like [Gigantopelta aegis]|uniref:protein mono-ADP-ribosyltransferase PARP11-like n=1 Tax=Gigantopelta aegis TaxID=1735272 RepID=UPI001B888439|nr:protein mono-ADP-ribosyltransferase PARP11-like [Gigantopelta aegis]
MRVLFVIVQVSDSLMALVTFDSMKALTYVKQQDGEDMPGESVDVQRLSTPSYTTGTDDDNMAELTQWCWYLNTESGTWSPYQPGNLQYTLEMKYLNGQTTYLFEREQHQYEVNFSKMRQTNLRTLKSRAVIRRPVFVSSDHVKRRKKESHPDLLIKKPAPMMTLPDRWALLDCYQTVELVKLSLGNTEEDELVQNLFFSTMDRSQFNIQSLFRIQNPSLWKKYCDTKATMEMTLQQEGMAGPVKEKQLFHGTEDNVTVIRGICHNNVDFRLSGKNGSVYGDGAYFARDAKYSHSYTKGPVRFMFLSRVLVGQYAKGDSSYRRPPSRVGHTLYDSCVNDVKNPSVYVIFDIAQSYPEYLMEYTVVESPDSVAEPDVLVSSQSGLPSYLSSTPGLPPVDASAYPVSPSSGVPSYHPSMPGYPSASVSSYPTTSVPAYPGVSVPSYPTSVATHPSTGVPSYPTSVPAYPLTSVPSYPTPVATHPTGVSSYPPSVATHPTSVPSYPGSSSASGPSYSTTGNVYRVTQHDRPPTHKSPEEKCSLQ